MSVSVRAEESVFTAGSPCEVVLHIERDAPLRKGDAIELQWPMSWSMDTGPSFSRQLQAEDAMAPHYIAVETDAPGVRFDIEITPQHPNCPRGTARHGRLVKATLAEGEVPAGGEIRLRYANTHGPYYADRDAVRIRVAGEAPDDPPVLEGVGGEHDHFRILAPSVVRPGEEFDVVVVSLDDQENLSATVFEGEPLTDFHGHALVENVRIEGRAVCRVRVDEEGLWRCSYRNTLSNAVRVSSSATPIYWGDIHIHTKLSHDGMGADPYGYARDVSALDFGSATDHIESLGQEGYEQIVEWLENADKPGEFAAIPADERNPPHWQGHHNLYFRDMDAFHEEWRRVLTSDDGKHWPPREAFSVEHLSPDRAMIIPHHTGIAFGGVKPKGYNTQAIDADAVDDKGLRPAVEIYSHHGTSEMYAPQHALSYEFNRNRRLERRANTPTPGPHYAQDYWMRGRRWGTIASSDEHTCQAGRRHDGITAAFAPELSRAAIFDAIRERRTYGTTGERILLEFEVDGANMGEEIRCAEGSELSIRLAVHGTDLLLRVEVLRHRFGKDHAFTPLLSIPPRPESMDYETEFTDTVEGPAVYYVRAAQEPMAWPDMAWSTPIWVDLA